ncbi:hypothetical protein HNY73_015603 [Argiope bruennichi]|uniref:Uncharacterized protein n=1 Tax=Argiope bruennichi TaxID=94029 RepID=A0A8T0EY52_ARGBR|nr:hypothetical protein HNY73_015603 [Argiope bruennichi]
MSLIQSPAMEGDGRSEDSSSCKSVLSDKSYYSGKASCASEFIISIQNHCRQLKNWKREINSADCKAYNVNRQLNGECSLSEKAELLKRLDDLNRTIDYNKEKLNSAKPCINKGCRTHDGNRNLCTYISTSQERMLRLNYTASTFIDTLQQMKENKLEHTAQYLEDYSKLKEIQVDIRNIANELDDITPCPLENCERHTPDNVKQPPQSMDIDNTPEKNNKKNTNTEENYQMLKPGSSQHRKVGGSPSRAGTPSTVVNRTFRDLFGFIEVRSKREKEKLLVYTFGSRDQIGKTYEVVKFTLCNPRDPEKSIEMEALLYDVISSSPFKVPPNKLEKMLKKWGKDRPPRPDRRGSRASRESTKDDRHTVDGTEISSQPGHNRKGLNSREEKKEKSGVRPPKKNLTPLRRSNAAVTSSSTPDKKLEPVKEDVSSKETELDSCVKKEKDAKEEKNEKIKSESVSKDIEKTPEKLTNSIAKRKNMNIPREVNRIDNTDGMEEKGMSIRDLEEEASLLIILTNMQFSKVDEGKLGHLRHKDEDSEVSVKLALRKTLGKTTLSREKLETLIIEIEGALSSRPLTYVFSDFQGPVSLTPAHLLMGRRVNSYLLPGLLSTLI